MLEQIAQWGAQKLVRYQVIKGEEQEIYVYGLQLIVTTGLVFLTLLGIGLYLRKMVVTLVFCCYFPGLRQYTGGYHASSYRKCFILSCGCYVLVLLATELLLKGSSLWLLLLSWGSCVYMSVVGSLNHPHNPKTTSEMARRKTYVRGLCIIISLLTTLACYQDWQYLAIFAMLSCTQGLTAVLMIAEQILRRYYYEKNSFKGCS